jgi:integral membrane protein
VENQFRKLAKIEGISLLIIIFITMPLKYYGNMPGPNKYIGMIHGFLFLIYVVFLIYITVTQKWGLKKFLLAGFASIIPFGPFLFDKAIFGKKA